MMKENNRHISHRNESQIPPQEKQLELLIKQLSSTSSFEKHKLDALKTELSTGTYTVQSHSLANKLIEHLNLISHFEPA